MKIIAIGLAVIMILGATGMVVADVDNPEEIPGIGPEYKESPTNTETNHENERVRPVYDRQEKSNM